MESRPLAFSQTLTGLSASTPYYFCTIGSDYAGTAFGNAVQSFTTSAASGGGSLSGSGTSSVTTANLTTEGIAD